MEFPPTVIIIAGPTASGKTDVAIQLAQHFSTEIISADSRQCFRELEIGVARPTPEQLSVVPHHFIASHSVEEPINAGYFEQYALSKVAAIFQSSNIAIMCGGTGLYSKAFIEGIDPMPAIPESVRVHIEQEYASKGLRWLQSELQHRDPDFWQQAEQQNPRRLQRALEVLEATGKSILHFRTATPIERPFRIIPMVISLSPEILRARINQRVDRMMEAGLVAEVKNVSQYQHLPALQTVGYKEVFQYLSGAYTLDTCIAKIKTNTWQYAKRQITWFKKQPGFLHLPIEAIEPTLMRLMQ